MTSAVIVGYARTPFHFAHKGALVSVRPDDMAAAVLRGLVDRTGIDVNDIEDVIMGCAYPEGEQGNNVGRITLLLAGLPNSVGSATINRFCGSSMNSVHVAAGSIAMGAGEVFIAAGIESMSRIQRGGFTPSPNPRLVDGGDKDFLSAYIGMGDTAENVATRWNISRAEQEQLAYESHMKATAAQAAGLLDDEIVPLTLADGHVVDKDGCIRPGTTLEGLSGLKLAFREDGSVTAGTSSPLTDGAAAVLVTSEAYARKHGLPILARIRSTAIAGVDPDVMGIGPVPASRKALARAGITAADLDVVEINEAFGSQAVASINELGLRRETVNIDGGAIALGHPLGATGARITGKAASLLHRTGGKFALATQCIGGGQGIATVLEAVG